MEQVFEGLPGVKVIMDDIIIHGHNTAERDAVKGSIPETVTFRWRSQNVISSRVKWSSMSMCSSRMVSGQTWKKVTAIVEMPRPTDKAGVRRLLGMVNYVSKFIPNLSDLTTPLGTLVHQGLLWHCGKQQETSFRAIKESLTLAPVLGYYDRRKALALGVDASSTGLGAAWIQGNQPVA